MGEVGKDKPVVQGGQVPPQQKIGQAGQAEQTEETSLVQKPVKEIANEIVSAAKEIVSESVGIARTIFKGFYNPPDGLPKNPRILEALKKKRFTNEFAKNIPPTAINKAVDEITGYESGLS